jgi:hypothetical protein
MNGADAEPAAMTPDQAVREVLRIEKRTDLILQRTVGMTWMLWATVNGGIFVSYEAISLARPTGPLAWLGFGLVWAPWVILGVLATTVLWRSLAIVAPPSPAGAGRVTTIATATFLVLVLGGLAVVTLANASTIAPFWAMFAAGIAAAVVGGSGLTTSVRSERTLWLVGGLGLAALAAVIELVAGRIGYDPLGLFWVLGPVASTALLFGGGLYTASR